MCPHPLNRAERLKIKRAKLATKKERGSIAEIRKHKLERLKEEEAHAILQKVRHGDLEGSGVGTY